MLMTIFDTIVAEATPNIKSAVSIVRLTGKLAFEILGKMVKKDVSSLQPRYMYYGGIYSDKNDKSTLIDRSMYVIFKGKESFCGEDTVEFNLHGSRIIVNQIIQACLKYGARLAKGGEFTYKAYYNNKLDLTEAEAINQLINSKTELAKDFALKSLEGTSSRRLKKIKEKLNLISAEIEVNIDYPEFDEDASLVSKVNTLLPSLIKQARDLSISSKQSLYIFNGIKVAIIGEPNIGKSTLLNKILNQNKAIVTNIPGTTRDVVEGEKEINGIIYKFFDTAGIRNADDQIEQIGIEKSYEVCKQADIILVLFNKNDLEKEIETLGLRDFLQEKKHIFVSTKRDIYGENEQADISISSTDDNLEDLFKLIEEKLDISTNIEVGLASEREIEILSKFIDILESIQLDLQNNMTLDIVEIKLVEATSLLDSLLNVSSSLEDIYQTIFKNFCIGK